MINIEDYFEPDSSFRATDYFKDIYKKYISEIVVDPDQVNMKDTVTLFHGTTTAYLEDILNNGLLPRKETKSKGNYSDEELHSIENVVYMTNKWHYMYAYNATDAYLLDKSQENGTSNEHWSKTWETLPCYIECHVPKDLLVADEDFFHTKKMSQKIASSISRKAMDEPIIPTWIESLGEYGTVGVIGGIKKEFIRSFSILGDLNLYTSLMLMDGPYKMDIIRWGQGKGKGKVKLLDLAKQEDSSLKNGTWLMKDIPQPVKIKQIGMNRGVNIAILFE